MNIFRDHFGYRRHAKALRLEQAAAFYEYARATNCIGQAMLACASVIAIALRDAESVSRSSFAPRNFRPGGVSVRPAN